MKNRERVVLDSRLFANNLKRALQSVGWNVGRGLTMRLAEHYGYTPQLTREWIIKEDGRYPTLETLAQIAVDTHTTIDELIGIDQYTGSSKVPILSMQQAHMPTDEEASYINGIKHSISADFATQIEDDSMIGDGVISLPKHTIVFINKDISQLKSGDIVLARINNSSNCCRRYIIDCNRGFLSASNSAFPTITDHFYILGIFCYAVIFQQPILFN